MVYGLNKLILSTADIIPFVAWFERSTSQDEASQAEELQRFSFPHFMNLSLFFRFLFPPLVPYKQRCPLLSAHSSIPSSMVA